MKKQYQKPQIYTEDVSIAFAQTCCDPIETPSGINQFANMFCSMCTIQRSYDYLQC
jgi:allophanate hydrolase subunit 1